jgi:hypothetical protein
MLLELCGHEDSEYIIKSFSGMYVNETATQNVDNSIFCNLGGGRCGTHMSTDVVEIATLEELDENDRFFTTSCELYVHHIWVTLSEFCTLFTKKKYTMHKLQLSVSVCRKQTEVCCFRFLCLQTTNGSCRFPLIPFSVCRILETWRHGHGDM